MIKNIIVFCSPFTFCSMNIKKLPVRYSFAYILTMLFCFFSSFQSRPSVREMYRIKSEYVPGKALYCRFCLAVLLNVEREPCLS